MIEGFIHLLDKSWIVPALGWTLVQFIWQGTIIAGVVWLVLIGLKHQSASLRYRLACGGLLIMLVCPVLTFVWIVGNSPGPESTAAKVWQSPLETEVAVGTDLDGFDIGSAFGSSTDNVNRRIARSESGLSEFGADTNPPNREFADPAAQTSGSEQRPRSADSGLVVVIQRRMDEAVQSLESWMPVFVFGWLMIVVGLSFRLLNCWLRVQKLTATAVAVNDERLSKIAQQICRQIGIQRMIPVLQSCQIHVPTVVGWIKPVVLMPGSALTGLPCEQLAAVLAHELAHVRRADYLINLMQSFVEILLFYHPCVWWLSNTIRVERENCCDDIATQQCDNPKTYAKALLQLEELKPTPTLTMAANGGSLMNRISRLIGNSATAKSKTQIDGTRPFWIAALGSLAIAGLAISSAISSSPPGLLTAETSTGDTSVNSTTNSKEVSVGELEPQEVKDKTMTVIVLDQNGDPLEGAHVHCSIWSKDRTFPPNQSGNTDADGKVKINLPKKYFILRLWASADGYSRLFSNWEGEEIKMGETPPSEYTFRMLKGVTIGGMIVDDKGKPVVGAKVGVSATATHPDQKRRPQFGRWYAEGSGSTGDTRLVTDDKGRWLLNTLPDASDLSVTVKVYHEDFIDDPNGELAKAQGVTTAQLLDQSAKIRMQQGVVVTGKITNDKGEPVDSGLVVWGDRPYWDDGRNEVRIDVDGSYELPALSPGQRRLTVMAPGYRPETRVVDVQSMMNEQDFELVTGSRIAIRIIDAASGEAIPGAFVQVNGWRNVESIYNYRHPNVMDSQIPIRANPAGVYQWNWAPDDEVKYTVGAIDYVHKDVTLKASAEMHVVELNRELVFAGTVSDTETGKRVPEFRVIPLRFSDPENRPDHFSPRYSDAQPGRSGRFRIKMPPIDGSYKLRIESEGYAPYVTEMYKAGDTVSRLKIDLEKAPWPKGQIVDQQGNSIEGVQVSVGSANQGLLSHSASDYKISNGIAQRGRSQMTDGEGSFKIPSETAVRTVVAIHPKLGYAQKRIDQDQQEIGQLVLRPWASLQGQILQEDEKPMSSVTVVFMANDVDGHSQHSVRTTTDENGQYQFPKLPPVSGSVRYIENTNRSIQVRHSSPVKLQPGKTATLDIENNGLLIKGKIRLSGTEDADANYLNAYTAIRKMETPSADLIQRMGAKGYDWRLGSKVLTEMYKAGDYQMTVHWMNGMREYFPWSNTKGEFSIRIESPGTYDVNVQYTVRPNGGSGETNSTRAAAFLNFTVDQEAFDKGELDLGLIELEQIPDSAK